MNFPYYVGFAIGFFQACYNVYELNRQYKRASVVLCYSRDLIALSRNRK